MIVMTGVAGAGKSIQAQLLATRLNIKWLSTGEILRAHLAGKSRTAMLEGELVKDDTIETILGETLDNLKTGEDCVLDGFPRTLAQAEWLLDRQQKGQINISKVVHLLAKKAVVHDRLIERGRPDDYEAAISKRFFEYDHAILPIIDCFKEAGVPVVEVNGEGTIEAVHQKILKALGQ